MIWHFSNIKNLKLIEKIQHRALRYIHVYDDFKSSYEELKSKANIPLVCMQRLHRTTTEVYKIVNSIGPSIFDKSSVYELRHVCIFSQISIANYMVKIHSAIAIKDPNYGIH